MLFLAIGFILFATQQGGKGTGRVDVPAEVNSFVHGENLPKAQTVNIQLQIPTEGLVLFWVDYGDAKEVFSRATGLKRQDRIGWLSFRDSEELDITRFHYYDIDQSDSLLFTDSFWRKLESLDLPVYRYVFLPVLVKDVDTPAETLKKIAQGLHTFIDPYLAGLLLANQKIRARRDILTLLAELPIFRGDAYAGVRKNAKELLSRKNKTR